MPVGTCAGLAEWQTRGTQNALSERACGFKSHIRHMIRSRLAAVAGLALLVMPSGSLGSAGDESREAAADTLADPESAKLESHVRIR